MDKGRAVSVRLDNGEVIGLDGVLASNVDPRRLALDLLGEAQIGESVAQKIKRYDWGQSFFRQPSFGSAIRWSTQRIP